MNQLELRRDFCNYFFERVSIDEEYRNVYNYVLGLYLGDGSISKPLGAKTYRLRFYLDNKYPKIISELQTKLEFLFVYNKANVKKHIGNSSEVYIYNSHIDKMFPQIGVGKKHDRDVSLVSWQKEILEPKMMLMGLFHSDGCYYDNKVVVNGKQYVYKNYNFTNCSLDLHDLFGNCLELLGLEYKKTNKCVNLNVPKPSGITPRTQSYVTVVSKRRSVDKLYMFIGHKS